jgi:DNA-binding GntR family transcriptional regulator
MQKKHFTKEIHVVYCWYKKREGTKKRINLFARQHTLFLQRHPKKEKQERRMPTKARVAVNGIQKETKQKWLYDQIKKAIIGNEYLPGAMLVERSLCEQYEISRTPVREALRQLANEGMVEQIIGKGAFVAEISFGDMIEIFEMREALEREAIKLFIIKNDTALIEKLQECFETQIKYEDSDPVKFMDKDMESHFIIAEGAKNKRLTAALATIYGQIEMMAISAKNDENLRKMARGHHQKIMDAILKQDIPLAEQCIVEHIVAVKKYHISKHSISS